MKDMIAQKDQFTTHEISTVLDAVIAETDTSIETTEKRWAEQKAHCMNAISRVYGEMADPFIASCRSRHDVAACGDCFSEACLIEALCTKEVCGSCDPANLVYDGDIDDKVCFYGGNHWRKKFVMERRKKVLAWIRDFIIDYFEGE